MRASLAHRHPCGCHFRTDDLADAHWLSHKGPSPYRPCALQHTTTIVPPCHPGTMANWARNSKLTNKRRFTRILQSLPSGEGFDLKARRSAVKTLERHLDYRNGLQQA